MIFPRREIPPAGNTTPGNLGDPVYLNNSRVKPTHRGRALAPLWAVILAAPGFPFQIFPPLAVEVHKLWPGQLPAPGESHPPGAAPARSGSSTPGNLGDPVYLNNSRER